MKPKREGSGLSYKNDTRVDIGFMRNREGKRVTKDLLLA